MLLILYYLHRPIAPSAAVNHHVALNTHGDFAWPLEVVTSLITQGSGFTARASVMRVATLPKKGDFIGHAKI